MDHIVAVRFVKVFVVLRIADCEDICGNIGDAEIVDASGERDARHQPGGIYFVEPNIQCEIYYYDDDTRACQIQLGGPTCKLTLNNCGH